MCDSSPFSRPQWTPHDNEMERYWWRSPLQQTSHLGYTYADWEKACELIDNTNWDSLCSDDINLSWSNRQQQFMGIIEECVPKGVLPPCKNLPWLNKNLICAMRKRNQLYKKAKQSGDFSKYNFAHNRVVSKLHTAKRAYFSILNPKSPKKFWKAMKYVNKSQSSIPTLSHGDANVQTDIGKEFSHGIHCTNYM